ncbi:MAG TPA: FMN-binding negative transcriptional regulator [Allosphingosinicella sp.]|nr:FMN-binding negative transcriptional regulator [Allosphingosinicella sp.]
MHPNRNFHWTDREAMLAFVAETAFAHLFVPSPEGPLVAHVPVIVTPDGDLRFHLSSANPLSRYLDGSVALASLAGPDAYVSPDWYGSADQVPTWNYITVEARGLVRTLPASDLVALLDDLSAMHEARLAPKPPWTRAKMQPGLFEGMLKAITGFEMKVESLRGTRKLGQNKKQQETASAAAGLEAAGRADMARLMRSPGD